MHSMKPDNECVISKEDPHLIDQAEMILSLQDFTNKNFHLKYSDKIRHIVRAQGQMCLVSFDALYPGEMLTTKEDIRDEVLNFYRHNDPLYNIRSTMDYYGEQKNWYDTVWMIITRSQQEKCFEHIL
jgi:hypothetical protein